jgi:hypothetical protein
MTEHVRELVSRPDLRDRFGAAAEQRAQTFTWDRSARAFLEVLRRVAGRPTAVEPHDPPASLNGHGPDQRQDDERRSTAAENR